MSLLAGSEEFNATKLFEVGKSIFFFNPNIGSVLLEIHFSLSVPSLDP